MAQILLPSTAILRVATQSDKTFVRSLAKKFSSEVGFLPDAALDAYLDMGGVQLAMENDEPAGYILGRDQLRWNVAIRPIFQAAIHFDAQRMHHGLALVTRREAAAVEAGQVALQACCREELDANRFWKAAGFEAICRMNPNNSRGHPVICWRKQITPFRPIWFTAPPPRSGTRAAKTITV